MKYCDKPTAAIHMEAVKNDEAGWVFSVRDNGIGIPESAYEEIFKPFTRLAAGANRDGTGLGLATCKKIVERHRGTIWCKSEPGSGTTLFFVLPEAIPPHQEMVIETGALETAPHRRHALFYNLFPSAT
jgi:signal transduction histidine kinase